MTGCGGLYLKCVTDPLGNKSIPPLSSLITEEQPGTEGLTHGCPRGKVLGGSSAINLMMYIRGQEVEYDDWARLTGFADWGWEGLKPYFLKSEGFIEPSALKKMGDGVDVPEAAVTHPLYAEEHHGIDGPIRTSFQKWSAPVIEDWHEAGKNAGFQWTSEMDAWSGKVLGGFKNLSTIDRSTGSGTRSYAASGYFAPNAGRPNLLVLTEALVNKVILHKDDTKVQATGLQFVKDGKTCVVSARREVILSAGTVQTPQLLELSGIGQPALLQSAGIECLVANEHVGEHLEDHIMTGLSYDLTDGEVTLDDLAIESIAKEAMATYARGDGGPLSGAFCSTAFLSLPHFATPSDAQQIHSLTTLPLNPPPSNAPALSPTTEHQILTSRLADPTVATIQLIVLPAAADPGRLDGSRAPPAVPASPGHHTRRLTMFISLNHAWSRGSIHLHPATSTGPPVLHPNYLAHPLDLAILATALHRTDAIFHTAPLAHKIAARAFPPPEMDMEDAVAREGYVRRHARTVYHVIGTAGLGRVVDARLRVEGVVGLRVVDASVLPLSVAGNIVASVYAVAEKGAGMIGEDWEGRDA